MRLTIVSRSVRLSDAMRSQFERRAQFALGRFAAAIRAVQVRLLDENGPRGGVDKRCQVLLWPRRGKPIVVERRGQEIHCLVTDALDRAARTVARALKRISTRRVGGRAVLRNCELHGE